MKSVLLAFFCLLGCAVYSQEAGSKTNSGTLNLKASQAREHIGANAVVSGTIAEVNKAERLVRLNFDQPFPKQPFTAVIFAAHTNAFPEVDKLKGKQVQVTGKITEYRDRPQIVLTSTNQLKVLEQPAEPPKKSTK